MIQKYVVMSTAKTTNGHIYKEETLRKICEEKPHILVYDINSFGELKSLKDVVGVIEDWELLTSADITELVACVTIVRPIPDTYLLSSNGFGDYDWSTDLVSNYKLQSFTLCKEEDCATVGARRLDDLFFMRDNKEPK